MTFYDKLNRQYEIDMMTLVGNLEAKEKKEGQPPVFRSKVNDIQKEKEQLMK